MGESLIIHYRKDVIMFTLFFIILNIMSGLLETGAVIFGMRNYGIVFALVAALLYQIGNLTPYPFKLSKTVKTLFASASAILMIFGMWTPCCVMVAIPFLALSLQSVRAKYKLDDLKSYKRILRMIGFFLGFGFNAFIGIVGSCIVVFAICLSDSNDKFAIIIPHFNRLQWILVFHELHYFVYCYAVMLIAYQYIGAIGATVLFFLSWIAYVSSRKLFYKNASNYKKAFIIGHSILVIILILIYFIPNMAMKTVCWLLTGIGGTTEFCIGELEKKTGQNAANHNCAENYGHIGGTLISIFIVIITKNLLSTVLIAGVFASVALILMFTKKEDVFNESM